MSFSTWVNGCFSYRGKALTRYRRGMAKAKRRDYDGAIDDYSAVIQARHIPADVKAMAIYNRALAYSAIQEDVRAIEDLASVLEMSGLPANIKMHAQQRQERLRRRKSVDGRRL